MARIHPTDTVATAATTTDDDRPDPPEIDGVRCEVAGCGQYAAVPCWSNKLEVWFRFCEDCAAEKDAQYDDLEVVE